MKRGEVYKITDPDDGEFLIERVLKTKPYIETMVVGRYGGWPDEVGAIAHYQNIQEWNYVNSDFDITLQLQFKDYYEAVNRSK